MYLHQPPGINFVPRGSLVFGAETVYGLVVYTGRDTKMAHHVRTPAWSDGRQPLLDSLLDKTFLTIIYMMVAGLGSCSCYCTVYSWSLMLLLLFLLRLPCQGRL